MLTTFPLESSYSSWKAHQQKQLAATPQQHTNVCWVSPEGCYLCVWLPPLWCFLGLELCPHYSWHKTHKYINIWTWAAFRICSNQLTRHSILDLCDVGKVSGVGDSQAAHPVSVSPLLQKNMKVQHQPLNGPTVTANPRESNNSNILRSASGRLWVLCKCSFHRSHSCSWCSDRAVYRASMELAAGSDKQTRLLWLIKQTTMKRLLLFSKLSDIKVRACPLSDLSASCNSSTGCVWMHTDSHVNTSRFQTDVCYWGPWWLLCCRCVCSFTLPSQPSGRFLGL